VGGGVAALLVWGIMAVSISGFTLRNPVELSVLIEPDVFLGSFFVALSVFLYACVGGVVLGPVFGTLVNRAVRAGIVAGDKDAGDDAAGKKDLVVR
jgi:NhaP-type Na+/H+ or K+/H+ antiporter